MGIEHERLLSLIDFAKESAKLKSNPVYEVASHFFHEYEHNLQGLPGLHFNVGGEDEEIWLVVDRLRESNAPVPKEPLLGLWLEVSNNLSKEPSLKKAIEFSKLLEMKLITLEKEYSEVDKERLVFFEEFEQAAEVESQLKSYIAIQWIPWVGEEKKRRRNIQLYGKLFTLKQQLDGSISDTQIEIAWGVGIAVWNMNNTKVCYPLISRLVDISINENTMSIEIRPRDLEARLELDIYAAEDNPGVTDLERTYKDFVAKTKRTFSPFDSSTFDGILHSAVACLDSKGIYWAGQTTADDRKLPPSTEELRITNTWVLLARPRSQNFFVQDLERFKTDLENKEIESLPKAILAVLTEPANINQEIELPNFRGISMVGGYESGSFVSSRKELSDLYFPMPFNDEQVRIVQLLEHYDGVVVQGPPGTGKTHTIANIIAHYFALGKRVLVTSMKDPALAVLRDKLPEEIRPLVINLFSNEREGMKQFEYAISRIASEIQVINKNTYRKEILELEQNIDGLHGTLARIDREIFNWAKKNLHPIIIENEEIKPMDAAHEVVNGQGQYEWLEDKLLPENVILFSNMDIVRLREARRETARDMDYLGIPLPEIVAFCDSRELMQIHHDLSQYTKLEATIDAGDLPPLVDYKEETIEEIGSLLGKVRTLFSLNQQMQYGGKWCSNAQALLKQSSDNLLPIIEIFDTLGLELKAAISERTIFMKKPVSIPKDSEFNEEIVRAIQNKAAGKSAFGLGGLIGKGAVRKKFEEIRVLTSTPETEEDWGHVYAYVSLQKHFVELITRWNGIANELEVECFEVIEPLHVIKAVEYHALHITIRKHIALEQEIINKSRVLIPLWKRQAEIGKNIECLQELQSFLESHILRHRLAGACIGKNHLQNILSNYAGKIINDLKNFIDYILGNPSVSEVEARDKWSNLMGELKRIHDLRRAFGDIQEICVLIEESGAKRWAQKLRTDPASPIVDSLLPDNWQNAWRLRRLATYLEKADAREELKKLARQRSIAEMQLAKMYKDIVAKRTWLKLAENATPNIRAALEAFRTSISKIGKGTGKRAVIFRRNAREASESANHAIPCWIMPHWRVSECLPAQFGCFDLVIIDEASQSDLAALPALLRAKKVLIVGDDKQVSPDGEGLEVDKIKNLMTRYLMNQVNVFRPQMDPGQSMYDLFKVVFAQSSTMLKEHFRCVGPIIEYSKREVYNHELKPMRLAKTSERLDPPLIDVLIEDGFRKGDVNVPEARFIVDEIKKICADELMLHRTIGVVSLLGDMQALKIWEMLETELGLEAIRRHEIACGDARTFQGKERDIMFLSMIVSPGDARAQTRDSMAQRFNVAASRARDRMYLVRSIELDQLSIKDKLRRNLISHFFTPYAQDERKVEDLRTLCESDFEREVYDILTERGYRVIPQVEVGEHRIDMVVEGHNDTRLAIECDGDRYHGVDRWESDMNRQRVLERVGWRFWRSFASIFIRNRKEVVADLISSLTERGIEPIGSDTAPRSVHTEHRCVVIFPKTEENDHEQTLTITELALN